MGRLTRWLFILCTLAFASFSYGAMPSNDPCKKRIQTVCKNQQGYMKACVLDVLKRERQLCARVISEMTRVGQTGIIRPKNLRQWQPLFATLAFIFLGIAWSLSNHERRFWEGHLNEPAPPFSRAMAAGIDLATFTTISLTLHYLFRRPWLGHWAVPFVLYWGYSAFAHSGSGRTFGKAIMGITVQTGDDERVLDLRSSFQRSTLWLLSTLILGLGHISLLWDSKSRSLADLATGSKVFQQVSRQ